MGMPPFNQGNFSNQQMPYGGGNGGNFNQGMNQFYMMPPFMNPMGQGPYMQMPGYNMGYQHQMGGGKQGNYQGKGNGQGKGRGKNAG
mmetsp:Transcript_5629/g.5141  ORF Transcript_5629/g.5141 Transcript_5629/m.5141 type:complete len:87 (-) Transcript_5629:450-710(-)